MGVSECVKEGQRLEAMSIELQKKSPKEALDAAWTASYYFLMGESCEKTNKMFTRVLMLMPFAQKGISQTQGRIFMYLETLDGTNLRQFKSFSIGAQEKLLSAKMSAKKEADALSFLASLGLNETAARCIFCYVLPHAHDFLKAIDLSQDKKHRCKLCAKDK